jgi:hypothetical protein
MPNLKPNRFGYTTKEQAVIARLSTPAKIQDYLNALSINFEPDGDTCRSPREVLRTKRAHCLEGALFAAAVLWYHGQQPLLLDLKAAAHDYDHVVTLFKQHGRWGAISKTNHAVLRYREPVYATVRELALSYFHEYFDHSGKKTLRSFSRPFSLKRFGTSWITDSDDLWEIGAALDGATHTPIAPPSQLKKLRLADPLEIEAGKLTEYKEKA